MANELRKKLAIVGMTGAVFAGGIFGLSGLASATTADENGTSTETSTPASEAQMVDGVDGLEGELSEFDGFSGADQELILDFETCLDDGFANLPEDGGEWTEENDHQVDALFEECEQVLGDLSFPAVEWLEGDDDWDEGDLEEFDLELSPEDEAVLDKFETCVESVEVELPENEADWTDEHFEQVESQFEACETILDDLSEDAGFFVIDGEDFEGCEDLFDDEHDADSAEEGVLQDSAA